MSKPDDWKRVLRRPEDAQRAAAVVSQFRCDQPVEIIARLYEPPYSDPQRNTFWMWCEDIARALRDGGTVTNKDEIHDFVLGRIFGWKESDLTGQKFPAQTLTRPRRSKARIQMILDCLEQLATEWNIPIRYPEGYRDMADRYREEAAA